MGRHYKGGSRRLQTALLAAIALVPLAGCGAVPMPGASLTDGPAATGAIAAQASQAARLDAPLPATLSYADATAIREAASHSFASLAPASPQSWANEETGSSGTVVAVSGVREESGAPCRAYDATVESLRGVHRYAATACREADGRLVLREVSGGA